MLALGWGLAAALGAVAGLMAVVSAPPLDPNYMLTIIVYAFAAAVLGGLDSPSARCSARTSSVWASPSCRRMSTS